MNVLIWGAGKYCEYVLTNISDQCRVVAIVDSNTTKQNKKVKDIPIIHPDILNTIDYDKIIISTIHYQDIIQNCKELNIPSDKIIAFWEDDDSNPLFKNRTTLLLDEKKRADIYLARLDSAPFEWGLKKTPTILSLQKCFERLITERCSLCRFGDGEFNIMLTDNEPWFQKSNEKLREKLFEVLNSNDKEILLGIAQNFREFEQYTEEAADEIRLYMQGSMRDKILNCLDMKRNYYNAYITRPYMIYKDKSLSENIFNQFKQLWEGKKILLIEGKFSRFGVDNDLLSGAQKVERILCPQQNAWSKYNEILQVAKIHAADNDIVCISLGPTATVLAYDLANTGVQAIDIGQLDNEYEWFINKNIERTAIEGKMVAEVKDNNISEKIFDKKYMNQIVASID